MPTLKSALLTICISLSFVWLLAGCAAAPIDHPSTQPAPTAAPINLPGNAEWTGSNMGGVKSLKDGRVLVGGLGAVWVFENGRWQKWMLPGTDERVEFINEGAQGAIYAATDTAVYKILAGKFSPQSFVEQDEIPWVVSESGSIPVDCKFNKRYSVFSDCLREWWRDSAGFHYTAKLLHVQADGSVIYANSRVVAKYENGKWKSFLFDTLQIESAAVDRDGSIWIYAGLNGVIRLAPDIFDTDRQ